MAVTTDRPSSGSVAALLARAGLEPVVLPCIEVLAVPDPELERVRAAARDADWLVLTSPRTVRLLWPDGGMPAVPSACVGRATAEAVGAAGGLVALTGEAGGRSLVEEVAARVGGSRVLFPRSGNGDLSHPALLERAGARVDAPAVYRVRPLAPAPDPVAGALFGSPSAVEGWCLSRPLDGLRVAAIGTTTAEALARRGGTDLAVAARPGWAEAVAALAGAVGRRSA